MKYRYWLVPAGFISFLILLVSCTDPQVSTQMKEMNIKMESMEKKMNTLSNNVSNLDSEFANLKKSFDMINSVFQIEVDNFKESSENLDRELQEINRMKRKFSDMESSIKDLDDRLDIVNQELTQVAESSPQDTRRTSDDEDVGSYYDVGTSGETQTYVVQPGDTLNSIARRYNTSVDAIREVNDLRSDIIQIGQRLEVPEN